MPIVAGIAGQPDFSALSVTIGDAEIMYGNFINALVAFLLVALALFLFIVKPMNALRARMARGEEVVEEVAPSPEVALLAEIRDELRRRPWRSTAPTARLPRATLSAIAEAITRCTSTARRGSAFSIRARARSSRTHSTHGSTAVTRAVRPPDR